MVNTIRFNLIPSFLFSILILSALTSCPSEEEPINACIPIPEACSIIDYAELQQLFDIVAYNECDKDQDFIDNDTVSFCLSCMETEWGEDFAVELTIFCSEYIESLDNDLLSDLMDTNESFEPSADFEAAIYTTTLLNFNRLIIKEPPFVVILDMHGFTRAQINELGLLYLEKILE